MPLIMYRRLITNLAPGLIKPLIPGQDQRAVMRSRFFVDEPLGVDGIVLTALVADGLDPRFGVAGQAFPLRHEDLHRLKRLPPEICVEPGHQYAMVLGELDHDVSILGGEELELIEGQYPARPEGIKRWRQVHHLLDGPGRKRLSIAALNAPFTLLDAKAVGERRHRRPLYLVELEPMNQLSALT